MLELTDVSFSVGAKSILVPIDLSLQQGECCVLLGPNGAGKSTLMKIASGYLSPTTGRVDFDGSSMDSINLMQRARKLGVLTQRNELDFPFTAAEVVALGRTPHGGGRIDDPVVQVIIDRLGIEPHAIYTHLSGGERQLVQVARSFAQIWGQGSSAFLLLDEPMTALDLRHQQDLMALLRELADLGTGLLIVMHDINMAVDLADRILLMKQGQVIAGGDPESVLTTESLERTFDTPMTLLEDGGHRFYKAGVQPDQLKQ